jgi:hypothetical protein
LKYKEIIVMPEISSSGIWIKVEKDYTGRMIDFEDLNLPEDLVKEFEDWVLFYDNDCHVARHFRFKAEMADELNKRGRDLALKLKKVLPEIKVFYRGEIDGDMLPLEEITGV